MKLAQYFDGTRAAVTGSVTAALSMAIGSVLEVVTGVENLWIWGFTLGFAGGMLVYTLISWYITRSEEESS